MSEAEKRLREWMRRMNHGRVGGLHERMFDAVLSAAKDAALEEAARLCMDRCSNVVTGTILARLLRELKSRPTERYLSESEVREMLRGVGWDASEAARRLGVDLDAKGECDHHRNPDCRHAADEMFSEHRPVTAATPVSDDARLAAYDSARDQDWSRR